MAKEIQPYVASATRIHYTLSQASSTSLPLQLPACNYLYSVPHLTLLQ